MTAPCSPEPPVVEIGGPVAGDLAMAVVVRRGLALVQRRHRRGVGFVHEFPGGAIEAGETWASAARRELLEEAGLRGRGVVGSFVHRAEGDGRIAFVVFRSNSTVPPHETSERRRQSFLWLAPEAIPPSDFHAADRHFIAEELPSVLRTLDGLAQPTSAKKP